MGRGRLEAFSDGVITVAITLLVLDLHTSASNPEPLTQQLLEEWPSFLAYILSFFVTGTIWVNHHLLFQPVERITRGTMSLNLLLLLFICTIPFSTSTLAEFVGAGGESARAAVLFYAAVAGGMALSFTLLLNHVLKQGLTSTTVDDRTRHRMVRRYGIGLVLYPAAAVVGLFAPVVMMVGLIVLSVYYLVAPSPLTVPEQSAGQGAKA